MTLAGCGKNWASRESEGVDIRSLSSRFPPFAPNGEELSFRRFENSRNVEVSPHAERAGPTIRSSNVYFKLQARKNTPHSHAFSFILLPLSFPYFTPHVSPLKSSLSDTRQIAKLPAISANLDPAPWLREQVPLRFE